MNEPKITILISTYNRAKYIKECIQSALAQTFSNFLVSVYDDGSTDDTASIIKKFKDDRIKYNYCKENKGVGFAKNQLLQSIETPYACWLDSDDMMHKERLQEQYNKIIEGNYDVVFCQILRFSGQYKSGVGKITSIDVSKYNKKDMIKGGGMAGATAFFKSNLQKFPISEKMIFGREDALWLRTIVASGKTFGYVTKPLYFCRFHSDRLGILKRRRNKIG